MSLNKEEEEKNASVEAMKQELDALKQELDAMKAREDCKNFTHAMRLLEKEIASLSVSAAPKETTDQSAAASTAAASTAAAAASASTAAASTTAASTPTPTPTADKKEPALHESESIDPEWKEAELLRPIMVVRKMLIPRDRYPGFNFVGKIVGPQGSHIRALVQKHKAHIYVQGRYSSRDSSKEMELLATGDPKHAHFALPLHVRVVIKGPPCDVYGKLAGVMYDLSKMLEPTFEFNLLGMVPPQRLNVSAGSFAVQSSPGYQSFDELSAQIQPQQLPMTPNYTDMGNYRFSFGRKRSHLDSPPMQQQPQMSTPPVSYGVRAGFGQLQSYRGGGSGAGFSRGASTGSGGFSRGGFTSINFDLDRSRSAGSSYGSLLGNPQQPRPTQQESDGAGAGGGGGAGGTSNNSGGIGYGGSHGGNSGGMQGGGDYAAQYDPSAYNTQFASYGSGP